MKNLKVFLSAMLLCLVMTGIAQAQEVIADYFYPEGKSSYYLYEDAKSGPIGRVNVNFKRGDSGNRLDRESPIPLIGSIKYLPYNGTSSYMLDITNYSVTANTWVSKDLADNPNAKERKYINLELLKLPAKDETLTWTTTVNENGVVKQIWEMSAKLTMIAVVENGERIAAKAIEVKRTVFDAQHNPIPWRSTTEYWQKGKGKIKVIMQK
jgi:hypothetical protein